VMRCEKVLVLVTSLMALGVVAVVGRSPPLLAVRRRWWSACGSRTGTTMVFGWWPFAEGRRRSKS